jgi:acyl dehydratase
VKRLAIDTKFIGKKYPTHEYEIGKEKIKEFARAIGDSNPLFLNDEKAKASKYGTIVAPPMFVVVYAGGPVGQMLMDGDLALNLMMLVHGEQEFEFGEVVKSGDIITTESEIVEIFEKKGKNFITMETTSNNQRGEMTAKGRWTFVVRG